MAELIYYCIVKLIYQFYLFFIKMLTFNFPNTEIIDFGL